MLIRNFFYPGSPFIFTQLAGMIDSQNQSISRESHTALWHYLTLEMLSPVTPEGHKHEPVHLCT